MTNQKYPWKSPLDAKPCCEPEPILEIENLGLRYRDATAFTDLSLNIYKGCVTGIVGPSGCGKSSFLHSLNRMTDFIPDAEVSGDILFRGKSIFDTRYNPRQLRREIGIVFQEPITLPLSIDSNISLPLREHSFSDVEDRVRSALERVGLWEEVSHKLKTPAANLSGGQKQRLCLARTIALEPEIILMDEPCSALDPIATETIEQLIQSLRGNYTIIIVTHNLAQARRLSDHVAAFWYNGNLRSGELIEYGTCESIFEKPKHKMLQEYVGGLRG